MNVYSAYSAMEEKAPFINYTKGLQDVFAKVAANNIHGLFKTTEGKTYIAAHYPDEGTVIITRHLDKIVMVRSGDSLDQPHTWHSFRDSKDLMATASSLSINYERVIEEESFFTFEKMFTATCLVIIGVAVVRSLRA